MSTTNVVSSPLPVAADKVVKEKKPTLPAKFAKFMQFGYFFVSSVKDAGAVDDDAAAALLERLCVFASVDDQKEFYQAWLDSAKESNKAMRKAVTASRKASAPPKTRAPRVKKDKSDSSDDNAKPKKTRAKKADKTNDLVEQLSALALPTPQLDNEVASELPAKKSRKPRAKKSSDSTSSMLSGNLV